jgi:putative ABC transport system permease protein
MNFIALDYLDILLASLAIAVNAGLSIGMRLGLEQRLIIAAVRMVAQLTLVGLVLKVLFSLASPVLTGFAILVMILFAGREAMARQDRKFQGWWSYGLGTGSMMAAGLVVLIYGLTTQIAPDPWYSPRYAIPLMGMILGNTMNGVSIGLDRMISGVVDRRVAIEARLCLGANARDAFRPVVRNALKAAFIPSINGMSAAGIVSLPGMMTGQILAGADPVEAVKYQIMISFLIAGGTGLGSFAAVYLARQRLTDARHRLRLDRLMPAKEL